MSIKKLHAVRIYTMVLCTGILTCQLYLTFKPFCCNFIEQIFNHILSRQIIPVIMKKLNFILDFVHLIFILMISCAMIQCSGKSETWPQFRGPDGSGVADKDARPPVEFGDQNLEWGIDIRPGVSSPVVWDNKMFITGYSEETKEIQVVCLNRKNGKVIWERSVKPDSIEKYQQGVSSPAQSTPVTDGERVVLYSGSCGLVCYDMNGNLLWKHPMACNRGYYGNATSPVLSDNKVFLIDDIRKNRGLFAFDKADGKLLWKTPFKPSNLPNNGGDATPVIYQDLAIVHRVGEIAAYSLSDGSPKWNYRTLTEAASTPIVADNKIITACWYNSSEENQRAKLSDFKELIQKYDSNKNNRFGKDECPADMKLFYRPEIEDMAGSVNYLKDLFWAFDKNKDNEIDEKEWIDAQEFIRQEFYKESGLIAIDPDSKGQVADTGILWQVAKNAPEVPSPIYYQDRVYMIKDGGILTCTNPETGEVIYNVRIGNPGSYLSSPVAANGLLYFFGYSGRLTIVKAGDTFKAIGRYDFKDNIAATPAIIGKSIYIRTKTKLLAYTN